MGEGESSHWFKINQAWNLVANRFTSYFETQVDNGIPLVTPNILGPVGPSEVDGVTLRERSTWNDKEKEILKREGRFLNRRTQWNHNRRVTTRMPDQDRHRKQDSVCIFDLYPPWKNEDFEKQLIYLSKEQRWIFEASWICSNELQERLSKIDNAREIVNSKDIRGRSPLFYACAKSHLSMVKWLLSFGANPNEVDGSYCITPLMCAAVAGENSIMEALLENGAEINQGLDPNANEYISHAIEANSALFWAVKAKNLSSVKYLLAQGAALTGSLMNKETPLHEAAYVGDHEILDLLLTHFSNPEHIEVIELKGGEYIWNTPLHIAVEQGHVKCVELLLMHGACPDSINSNDQTPLHLAVSTADQEAMIQILAYQANVNSQDQLGRTPSHYCVHFSKNHQDTSECLELLLKSDADINIQDDMGCTVFHLAVLQDCSPLAAILLRSGADLTKKTKSGHSGLELLVKKMPHAMRYVRESLDLAINSGDKDVRDPNCTLTFDFRAIVPTCDRKRKIPGISAFYKEMEFLSSLCAYGFKDILSHPLIEAFLILKWQRVRKYFWASFISNLLMVLAYSEFLTLVYILKCSISKRYDCENQLNEFNNKSISDNYSHYEEEEDERNLSYLTNCFCPPENQDENSLLLNISWIILFIMVIIFGTKEVLQMIQNPIAYAKHLENYLQILFVCTIFITIAPVIEFSQDLNNFCLCKNLVFWEYRFAAIGMLTAWILTLLRIGKMPRLGLYVQMLIKVAQNFILFMSAYSSILIGFTLAFNILYPQRPEFKNIFDSFLTVIVMMTGEVVDIRYVSKERQTYDQPLPYTTYLLFAFFLLLITIVLMNLLVGLAVSDIQELHEEAKVARLNRLVLSISQLESLLFSRSLFGILPYCVRKLFQRDAILVATDSKETFDVRPHDPRDNKLPQELKMDALSIVESLMAKKSNKSFFDENEYETSERMTNIEKVLDTLGVRLNEIFDLLTRHPTYHKGIASHSPSE